MTCRSLIFLCFLTVALCTWQGAKGNNCNDCHALERTGFAAGHAFAAADCTLCHGGNDQSTNQAQAHAGMTGFPGHLDNAAQACGSCHAEKVASVEHSLMNTGRGMVEVTRRLVDGDVGDVAHANLQSLGHGPADSMLRKLCASCHLGQEKKAHELSPVSDRGGGCLACHINDYPDDAHPALTRNVSDARCFGCHSRSARISLSYAGLAETNPPGNHPDLGTDTPTPSHLRLPDGRYVERKPADVHFTAGMTCTECHKGTDLMAAAGDAVHQRDAVDASCGDCHGIEGTDDQVHDAAHERLECATCHSQWAPQCFGCHMEYDADGRQWDHIEQRETAGRWNEQRSDFHNDVGALGVNEDGRIELFIPGMIMTLVHPDWEDEKFVRAFAPISPHTIGAARSCESCHRSSIALGLGKGAIELRGGEIQFTPDRSPLQDGLPADAWTNIDGSLGGTAARDGQRPLNKDEMEAVLAAPLK
ncbi:MAG: hypothetical protein OER91_01020 [Gammaproteobacteria bacterium]|nr:hypothetical protein [Gammaproteobacteria bacterium]